MVKRLKFKVGNHLQSWGCWHAPYYCGSCRSQAVRAPRVCRILIGQYGHACTSAVLPWPGSPVKLVMGEPLDSLGPTHHHDSNIEDGTVKLTLTR